LVTNLPSICCSLYHGSTRPIGSSPVIITGMIIAYEVVVGGLRREEIVIGLKLGFRLDGNRAERAGAVANWWPPQESAVKQGV